MPTQWRATSRVSAILFFSARCSTPSNDDVDEAKFEINKGNLMDQRSADIWRKLNFLSSRTRKEKWKSMRKSRHKPKSALESYWIISQCFLSKYRRRKWSEGGNWDKKIIFTFLWRWHTTTTPHPTDPFMSNPWDIRYKTLNSLAFPQPNVVYLII